jgi:hypothetical protein
MDVLTLLSVSQRFQWKKSLNKFRTQGFTRARGNTYPQRRPRLPAHEQLRLRRCNNRHITEPYFARVHVLIKSDFSMRD